MILLSIFTMLVSGFVQVQANDLRCTKLADKNLEAVNYGSFKKQNPGVTKTPLENGSFKFQATGGPTLIFSEGKIVTSQYIFGMNTSTIIEFDKNCEISSISGGSYGGFTGAVSFSKADPTVCIRLRLLAMAPTPMLTIPDQLSFTWCGQYFPEENTKAKEQKKTSPPAH